MPIESLDEVIRALFFASQRDAQLTTVKDADGLMYQPIPLESGLPASTRMGIIKGYQLEMNWPQVNAGLCQ